MVGEIALERIGCLAWITFNRPHKRNALSVEMWDALSRNLEELAVDSSVRAVVLRGADETCFSAGADIAEFGSARSSQESVLTYSAQTERVEELLRSLPKPTIAMIQGICFGAGCNLAICCDLRLSDETSNFAITPAKLGLVYSPAATQRLVDLVGPAKAKYLLFSALPVDAKKALAIGLIDEILPSGELLGATRDLAHTLAIRSPVSLYGAKRLIDIAQSGDVNRADEAKKIEIESYFSADYREGVKAFMERRTPQFGHR